MRKPLNYFVLRFILEKYEVQKEKILMPMLARIEHRKVFIFVKR